jgi:hypothetical protein
VDANIGRDFLKSLFNVGYLLFNASLLNIVVHQLLLDHNHGVSISKAKGILYFQ